jgi:hypothetical protein
MGAANGADPWAILPNLLWFIFALIALRLFKDDLRTLLSNVVQRVKAGAALRIGSFELGETRYISPTGDIPRKGNISKVQVDKNGDRHKERENYYEPNREVFLVHRLAPSERPNQLYDILIYLIPHRDATLACVQKVDYYFGHHWKSRIFTSIDRESGFAVSTSAFGPFVCTAKIHFTDGESAMIWRYIDFEMGEMGRK